MQLEAEKEKAQKGFLCFSGCYIVINFTRKPKDIWATLFLKSDFDIFKVFQLLPTYQYRNNT